jgi:hypothetical protein
MFGIASWLAIIVSLFFAREGLRILTIVPFLAFMAAALAPDILRPLPALQRQRRVARRADFGAWTLQNACLQLSILRGQF